MKNTLILLSLLLIISILYGLITNKIEKYTSTQTISNIDTVEFRGILQVDTSNLEEEVMLVLQNEEGILSSRINLSPLEIKKKYSVEKTDNYYILAYLEDEKINILVEEYNEL